VVSIRGSVAAYLFLAACSSRPIEGEPGVAQPTSQKACIRNAYPDETVCYPTDDWGTRTRSQYAPGARLVGTRFAGVEQVDPTKPSTPTVSFADFYDPERRHERLLVIVVVVGWYDPPWSDDDVLALAEQGVRVVKVFTKDVPPTETAHNLTIINASTADLATLGVDEGRITQSLFVDTRSMEILARTDTPYGDPLSQIQTWLAWSMANPPRETAGAPRTPWTSPACDGHCLTPPFGWRFVARGAAGAQCPAGTDGATPIVTDAMGDPASCTCSCDPTPSAPAQNCSVPNFVDMEVWQDAACKTSGLNSYFGVNGCIQNTSSYAYSSATELGAYAYVNSYPTTHAVCATPTTTTSVPAATSTAAGTQCEPTTLFDACGADAVCTPPPKSFYRCVERDGQNACPNDYPSQTLAGDGYTDTRDCTACMCGASEHCSGTLSVYSDTSCADAAFTLPLGDFSCHPLGESAFTPGSLSLSALTPEATCGVVSHPQPIGGVSLTHQRTICCQF
jgi:hypothetical protein